MRINPVQASWGGALFVCSECWRAFPAAERQSADGAERIHVPLPHTNAEGDPCPGTDWEAIAPWE